MKVFHMETKVDVSDLKTRGREFFEVLALLCQNLNEFFGC